MNDYREKLIAAAEAAYRQEQERAAGFRAYCAQSGLPPETAEDILRADDPKELSSEQLKLFLYYGLGLPPGYSLTKEQLRAVLRSRVGKG